MSQLTNNDTELQYNVIHTNNYNFSCSMHGCQNFKIKNLKLWRWRFVNSLVLSLFNAEHSMRHTDSIWERSGWLGAIRMVSGRFSEVGSRISWVRWKWFGCSMMLFVGKCLAMTYRSTGISLVLVSAVPLHRVRKRTMSSTAYCCWLMRDMIHLVLCHYSGIWSRDRHLPTCAHEPWSRSLPGWSGCQTREDVAFQ